jgi:hypothetical protein
VVSKHQELEAANQKLLAERETLLVGEAQPDLRLRYRGHLSGGITGPPEWQP